MLEKPYITIITSTYNASETLERCLTSVERQSFSHLEHIIVDGCSADGTVECIRSHAQKKDSRISWWISEPDNGIYHAWNKALPHIKGEWVQFLGADDYLYAPDTMELVSQILKEIPAKTDVAYGKTARFSKVGGIKAWYGNPWDEVKHSFFNGRCLPHQGLFQRTQTFFEQGGFDEQFRILGDYDMLLRVLKERDAIFMDLPITMMQIGGISSDPTWTVTAGYETYQALHKNGFGSFTLYLKYYLKFRGIELMYNYFPSFTVYIRNVVRKWKGEELISSLSS